MNSRDNGNFFSKHRRLLLVLFDIGVVLLAYLGTWALISGRESLTEYRSLLFSSCVLFVLCFVTVYELMGLYDSLWNYAELYEFFRCALGSVIAITAFLVITLFIYKERRVPISVYIMSSLFSASLTLYTRLTYRMIRNTTANRSDEKRRVMLIGAGNAASTLLHELFRDPNNNYNVICAVDDDPNKQGRTMMGVKIMGTTNDIPALVTQCEIDTLLLAIPSADEVEKQRILKICSQTKCNMRTLPDICKLISDGKELLERVRDVKMEDLLGREEIDLQTTHEHLQGKVVMVTGGGGSIGSVICNQVAASKPKKLILVEMYENSAYDVQQKLLMEYGTDLDIDVRICSIRDSRKIDSLMNECRPEIVFHAAAQIGRAHV